MVEENINTIVSQANDQLDILQVYVKYRVAFHIERIYNRMCVLQSVGDFGGTLEFHDVSPIAFNTLVKAYDGGLSKEGIIKATNDVIKELDDDVEKLLYNGRR